MGTRDLGSASKPLKAYLQLPKDQKRQVLVEISYGIDKFRISTAIPVTGLLDG